MICPVCKSEVPGYSQYCSYCGAPMGKRVVFSPSEKEEEEESSSTAAPSSKTKRQHNKMPTVLIV